MQKLIFSTLMALSLTAWADIRVLPVARTPEPDSVNLEFVFPVQGEVRGSGRLPVQFRLDGYPVGIETDVPRSKEIYNDTNTGQCIEIQVDQYPPFTINESLIDALDDNADYYEQILEKTIPYNLGEGMHVIRSFPVRSFGESLKNRGTYAAMTFYIKTKKDNANYDLKKPYLVYNEPTGTHKFDPSHPILLDFLIKNCQLSKDGYIVRLIIDETNRRMLTDWVPYYIYGLSRGKHTIRLQLLNPQGNVLPGPFNDVTKTITIE